jgi:hypothetical protein
MSEAQLAELTEQPSSEDAALANTMAPSESLK